MSSSDINIVAANTVEPKIELRVHLEGAVRPRALLEIAARNGSACPRQPRPSSPRFISSGISRTSLSCG
jgi:adenosine deaminase